MANVPWCFFLWSVGPRSARTPSMVFCGQARKRSRWFPPVAVDASSPPHPRTGLVPLPAPWRAARPQPGSPRAPRSPALSHSAAHFLRRRPRAVAPWSRLRDTTRPFPCRSPLQSCHADGGGMPRPLSLRRPRLCPHRAGGALLLRPRAWQHAWVSPRNPTLLPCLGPPQSPPSGPRLQGPPWMAWAGIGRWTL